MGTNIEPRVIAVEELVEHARQALERQYLGVDFAGEVDRPTDDGLPTMRLVWFDGPTLMEAARVLEPYSNMTGASLYYLNPSGEMLFRSPGGVVQAALDAVMPDGVEIVRQEPHYTHIHREETMLEEAP